MFALTCSSTSLCLGHLALLGQYQKCILFLLSLPKKDLIAEVSRMTMFWRELTLDSKIFLPAVIKSVMTIMLWTFSIFMARISPVQIAMSLASRAVMFMELTCNFLMTTLLDQIWAAAVMTCDFFTPPSAMTTVLLDDTWESLKVSGSAPRFCPNRKRTLGFYN